jgi:hypothetical protein
MAKHSKADRVDRNRQVIAGMQKHYASAPSIVLDGVSHTLADIVKVLQAPIDTADVATTTASAFHKAVAADKAARAASDVMYRSLRAFLVNLYKTSPEVLADFGITLPSRQAPDAATTAAAVVKRGATRVARHTLGKRQKAGIKGQVAPVPAPTPATKPT